MALGESYGFSNNYLVNNARRVAKESDAAKQRRIGGPNEQPGDKYNTPVTDYEAALKAQKTYAQGAQARRKPRDPKQPLDVVDQILMQYADAQRAKGGVGRTLGSTFGNFNVSAPMSATRSLFGGY